MPKGDIVGRFTVGSKIVIDGKKNDGKDQHDQQHSDNFGYRELKSRNTSPRGMILRMEIYFKM
jgi:hypothetical protein